MCWKLFIACAFSAWQEGREAAQELPGVLPDCHLVVGDWNCNAGVGSAMLAFFIACFGVGCGGAWLQLHFILSGVDRFSYDRLWARSLNFTELHRHWELKERCGRLTAPPSHYDGWLIRFLNLWWRFQLIHFVSFLCLWFLVATVLK